MATLSDLPYDEHRLVVVVALGFFVFGAIARLPRVRVASAEAGAALVLVPAAILVLVAGAIVTHRLWAGQSDGRLELLSGVICVLAWLSGIQLRNELLRPAFRVVAVLPFLVTAGLLWTRDSIPPLDAAAATRVLDASRGQGRQYVCHRYASSGYDPGGVSGAQFQCDVLPPEPVGSYCKRHSCDELWVSFDQRRRIRSVLSVGAP
jgi:hypothetical protein